MQDIQQAKLRKELALAEKYELQTAKERGELVHVDELHRIISTLATTAVNALRGMPAALVPRLVGLDGAEMQAAF